MTDRRREETRIMDQLIPDSWTSNDNGPTATGKEDDDQRIYMDVCDRLRQFNLADCTRIDVQVSAGVVTLTGDLPNADVQRVDEVVRSVAGVREIKNKLRH